MLNAIWMALPEYPSMSVRLPWLSVGADFPDPERAWLEPNGLLCAGGDLSPTTLLKAYARGIFPWYNAGDPILWWSPDPRGVLWHEDLHISRSMRRLLKQQHYRISTDLDFRAIIEGCAAPRPYADATWIQPAMQQAYCALHAAGHAHSIEVWDDQGQLAGGLYGICIGRMFYGESMFSRQPNASKCALIVLSRWLAYQSCPLIDTQFPNPHLLTLGATTWPRAHALKAIRDLTQKPAQLSWGNWIEVEKLI